MGAVLDPGIGQIPIAAQKLHDNLEVGEIGRTGKNLPTRSHQRRQPRHDPPWIDQMLENLRQNERVETGRRPIEFHGLDVADPHLAEHLACQIGGTLIQLHADIAPASLTLHCERCRRPTAAANLEDRRLWVSWHGRDEIGARADEIVIGLVIIVLGQEVPQRLAF